MWNETNFLIKGFVDEVKGVLTKGVGSVVGSYAGYSAIGIAGVCLNEAYAGVYTSVGSAVIE